MIVYIQPWRRHVKRSDILTFFVNLKLSWKKIGKHNFQGNKLYMKGDSMC